MAVKKILLVEDDIDIRENMANVLNYEGHETLEAEHGAEAMAILESGKNNWPDVILLDLFMPVMNGREFLDAINTSSIPELKNIPVILITASEHSAREDLDGRTRAILRKPIDLKVFLNLLDTLSL